MSALLSRPLIQFMAAYESGSLVEAARNVGVTQTAVTRGLRSLEDRLQLKLFDRQGHRLEPNQAGVILYRYASDIGEILRRLDLELASYREDRKGILRIGVGPIWSRHPLPAILAQLSKDHPKVRIEVLTGIAPSLMDEFRSKRIDLFIGEVNETATEGGARLLPLWKTERTLWVRKGHQLTKLDQLQWEDLSAWPWIGHEHDRTLKKRVAGQFLEVGVSPPDIAIEASSLEFILAMLGHSDMLAVLADVMANESFRHGLVQLPFEFSDLSLSAAVLYHGELEELQPVRRLLNLLKSAS